VGPAGTSYGGCDVPVSETEGTWDGPLPAAQEKVALCKCLTNLDGHGYVTYGSAWVEPQSEGFCPIAKGQGS
jgi:hypothetical protein